MIRTFQCCCAITKLARWVGDPIWDKVGLMMPGSRHLRAVGKPQKLGNNIAQLGFCGFVNHNQISDGNSHWFVIPLLYLVSFSSQSSVYRNGDSRWGVPFGCYHFRRGAKDEEFPRQGEKDCAPIPFMVHITTSRLVPAVGSFPVPSVDIPANHPRDLR